ncbi:MAG: hypothetical protein CL858_19815 [Cupriavidus sp.]|nr:hypothetical protein [Cupriavidus sp.]
MPTSFRDIHDSLVARGLIVDHDFSSLKPDDKLPAALRDALAHYVPAGNGIQLHPRVRDFDSPTLQAILDALNRPHCGVPNGSHGPTQIQTFGSPGGRWDRGVLTFSIDPAGSGLPPNDVVNTIAGAFAQWQAASGFFSFTRVDSGGDIQLRFGGTELRSYFGSAGGVLADGGYPPSGRINFDSAEAWTTAGLLSVSLHEIGHVLGLSHSNDRRSLMYPYDLNAAVIDSESTDAIRNLYGWRPQIQLGDRATSDRPALAVRSRATSTQTLHMVWKGTGDDQGIYESQLVNNVWSQQKKISGIGSTESPALATIRASDTSNGLIMAWKGVKGDQGLYYSIIGDGDWAPQRKIPNVGSNHRPALANFNGTIYMAWKGVDGDQGIYWSILSGGNWTPQRKINGVGTSAPPALAALHGRLFMFWKGVEGDDLVYWSSIDNQPGAIWQPQRVVSYVENETEGGVWRNIGNSNGPSATVRGNRILLAWKGIPGDSGIYFSLFDGNEFTGQINVAGVGTSQGPGVCTIGGITHMLWKGVQGDNTIWWSTL